jgi:branched-chain amino acid transport system permease protein
MELHTWNGWHLRTVGVRLKYRSRSGGPARPGLRGIFCDRGIYHGAVNCATTAPPLVELLDSIAHRDSTGIPVLRMRGDYLAIVTLGFGEIIRILSQSDMLTSFSGGPKGVINIAGPTLFGKPFGSDIDFVYLIMLACLLIIFVTTRLQNSRVGRAWEAMREDETVARANGINTLTHKLLAFAIGAAFAGLGGALFASRNQFTGPEDHNLMVSINVMCLVIVGGMGSIPGVIAGAFALKGLPEVLRQLENYRVLTFGALLVVMMIWLPEGIIPSKRRQLEMHSETEETPLETKPGAPPGIPKEDRVSPSPAAVFPTDVKEP